MKIVARFDFNEKDLDCIATKLEIPASQLTRKDVRGWLCEIVLTHLADAYKYNNEVFSAYDATRILEVEDERI